MKTLLTACLLALIVGCTKDHKQTKWKVVVTSENPMSSVYVSAGLPGSGTYTDDTGENYNSTSYEKEFKASKMNEIKVVVNTYNAGNINIKIYQKNDVKKEEDHVNPTAGSFACSTTYKN